MKLRSSLIFNGQTEAAFNHYKTIFNGEFIGPIVRVKDTNPELAGTTKGDRVLHIALDLGQGQLLTGNDSPDVPEDLTTHPQNFTLFVEADSEKEGHHLFDALAQDGQVVIPLQEQEWGDYFGHLVDKFGVKWDVQVISV